MLRERYFSEGEQDSSKSHISFDHYVFFPWYIFFRGVGVGDGGGEGLAGEFKKKNLL